MAARQHPSTLEPGTVVGVVGVTGHSGGMHSGVVSDRLDEYGLPLVIAASHRSGRVQEEAWLAFTEGKDAKVFPAVGARAATLTRARGRLGQSVASAANCEQFAASVRAEPSVAPILAGAAIAVAAVAVIAGALMLLVDEAEEEAPAPKRRPAASR